jgi:hypothetical protein
MRGLVAIAELEIVDGVNIAGQQVSQIVGWKGWIKWLGLKGKHGNTEICLLYINFQNIFS